SKVRVQPTPSTRRLRPPGPATGHAVRRRCGVADTVAGGAAGCPPRHAGVATARHSAPVADGGCDRAGRPGPGSAAPAPAGRAADAAAGAAAAGAAELRSPSARWPAAGARAAPAPTGPRSGQQAAHLGTLALQLLGIAPQ